MTDHYASDAEDAFLEAAYEDLTHIQDEPDDSRCPGHDPYPHSCSLDRDLTPRLSHGGEAT